MEPLALSFPRRRLAPPAGRPSLLETPLACRQQILAPVFAGAIPATSRRFLCTDLLRQVRTNRSDQSNGTHQTILQGSRARPVQPGHVLQIPNPTGCLPPRAAFALRYHLRPLSHSPALLRLRGATLTAVPTPRVGRKNKRPTGSTSGRAATALALPAPTLPRAPSGRWSRGSSDPR